MLNVRHIVNKGRGVNPDGFEKRIMESRGKDVMFPLSLAFSIYFTHTLFKGVSLGISRTVKINGDIVYLLSLASILYNLMMYQTTTPITSQTR